MSDFITNGELRIEAERLCDENERLQAENAKLREFAQAMAEVAYEGQMLCDKCRFFNGCYNGGKKEHEGRGCQWLLWARELGIEVEDDD